MQNIKELPGPLQRTLVASATVELRGEFIMIDFFKDMSPYVFASGSHYKTAFLIFLCCSLWWLLERQMKILKAPEPSQPLEQVKSILIEVHAYVQHQTYSHV